MHNRFLSLCLLLFPSSFVYAGQEDPVGSWTNVVSSGSATDFAIGDDALAQCVTFYAENSAMQQRPKCAFLSAGEFVTELALPYVHDVKAVEKQGEQVVPYASTDKCSYSIAFDVAHFDEDTVDPGVPTNSASVEEFDCWR